MFFNFNPQLSVYIYIYIPVCFHWLFFQCDLNKLNLFCLLGLIRFLFFKSLWSLNSKSSVNKNTCSPTPDDFSLLHINHPPHLKITYTLPLNNYTCKCLSKLTRINTILRVYHWIMRSACFVINLDKVESRSSICKKSNTIYAEWQGVNQSR